MKKILGLSLLFLILSSCGGGSGGSANDPNNPGLFNKEIKTPTPNEHHGLWQANLGSGNNFSMKLRMYVEEDRSQFTLRCQNLAGTIYANFQAPTQLEFTSDPFDSIAYLRFLQSTGASARGAGMQCGLRFSSGDALKYFSDGLMSGLTLPSDSLQISFYSDDNNSPVPVGNWPHENLVMDKIGD